MPGAFNTCLVPSDIKRKERFSFSKKFAEVDSTFSLLSALNILH